MADAPETVAREALQAVLEDVYAAEQFPVKDDYLDESLGEKGTVIAVSVERAVPRPGNTLVNEIQLKVQFYGKWVKKADPYQTVSGAPIEDRAHRFRTALRTRDPRTDDVWYFSLDRIEYPRDPTGNKTRYEAYVTATGNNSALIETTA